MKNTVKFTVVATCALICSAASLLAQETTNAPKESATKPELAPRHERNLEDRGSRREVEPGKSAERERPPRHKNVSKDGEKGGSVFAHRDWKEVEPRSRPEFRGRTPRTEGGEFHAKRPNGPRHATMNRRAMEKENGKGGPALRHARRDEGVTRELRHGPTGPEKYAEFKPDRMERGGRPERTMDRAENSATPPPRHQGLRHEGRGKDFAGPEQYEALKHDRMERGGRPEGALNRSVDSTTPPPRHQGPRHDGRPMDNGAEKSAPDVK